MKVIIISVIITLLCFLNGYYCGNLWGIMPATQNTSAAKMITLQNGIGLARNTWVGHSCLQEFFGARDPSDPAQAGRWRGGLCCYWNPNQCNTSISTSGDCVYDGYVDPIDIINNIALNHGGIQISSITYTLVRNILCTAIAIAGGDNLATSQWIPACNSDFDQNLMPDLVTITSNPPPCRTSNITYNWKNPCSYTSKFAGNYQITYVWADTLPHSVQDVTTGNTGLTFYGIGGGSNSIASATTCTASDLGYPVPVTPCNYWLTADPTATTYNYSKYIAAGTSGSYSVDCSVHKGAMTNAITVTSNQNGGGTTGTNTVNDFSGEGSNIFGHNDASSLENFLDYYF